jgi:hypothetical protein
MSNYPAYKGQELDPILGVVANPQTYRNIAYLLLAFPLGIFYFVFLVTGFSVGISLAVVWVGLPILLGVLLLSRVFANLERNLTNNFLGTNIALSESTKEPQTLWQRAKNVVMNPSTWAEVFYLFSKFVLGIFSFVVVVTLLATSLGLIATPLFWQYWGQEWNLGIPGIWEVDSFSKAVAMSAIGAILGVASLHFTNGLAWLYSEYTKAILGPAENN